MKPKIVILDNKVWINGERAKEKRISWSLHCRDIFYNKEYVVKVKTKATGEQNDIEYYTWTMIDDEDKKYFAPIIDYKVRLGYLVQKRIYPSDNRRTRTAREIVSKMCSKYKIDDVEDRDDNWCMIDKNHPVIWDYGV